MKWLFPACNTCLWCIDDLAGKSGQLISMHHVTCQPWKIWLPKNAHFFTPPTTPCPCTPIGRPPGDIPTASIPSQVSKCLVGAGALWENFNNSTSKRWGDDPPFWSSCRSDLKRTKEPAFWKGNHRLFFKGNLGLGEMFRYEFGWDHWRCWVPNFFYLQKITWGNDPNWAKNHQDRLSFDGFRFLWVWGI